MEVLIVSKTHMSSAACVGGLVLDSNRYVRLLDSFGHNQPTNTEFEVGEVWDLEFVERPNIHPPHLEDVLINSKRLLHKISNTLHLLSEKQLIDWRGHIDNVFDGLLHWTTSGTGYIPVDGEMPSQSVGFWLTDKGLIRRTFNNRERYTYPNGTIYRNIAYVGFEPTLPVIPSGTLLRVSLSRVFPSEQSEITAPRGYYLQLSGWYF